jgi:hypothetical protein
MIYPYKNSPKKWSGYIISLENQLAQAELTRRELHNIIQVPYLRPVGDKVIFLGSQNEPKMRRSAHSLCSLNQFNAF